MKKVLFAAMLTASALETGFAQTITLPGYFTETAGSGYSLPTTMAFITTTSGDVRYLILEKATGRVKYYNNGTVTQALDLPVSSNSERGLLGICIDPNFASNNFVYLYYSRATVDGGAWLDNRVEKYVWNGATLTLDSLIISFPFDAGQSNGPNHDGGIIRIGADQKLYVITGDLNRAGIEQNQSTTFVSGVGGVHRLNLDGSIPTDNPFFFHSDQRIRTLYVYGVRNSFGMAVDPLTGFLWWTENGPNTYDEVDVAPTAGMNSGWSDIMGPDSRDPQGVGDLTMLTNAYYRDPEFSWLTPIAVTSINFLSSTKFYSSDRNKALIGDNNIGQLYLFDLVPSRDGFVLSGGLADRVADSSAERDLNRIGTSWGVVTDLQLGPDGYMYVTSLTQGRVTRIRPVTESVGPSSFTVTRGLLQSGGLSDLQDSDDNRMVIQQRAPFAASDPNAQLVAETTSPFTTATELRFKLEASTTGAPPANVTQRIELFNFTTNAWVMVDERPATSGDSVIEVVNTSNPLDFVQTGTRLMRARVGQFDRGVLTPNWAMRVDQTQWTMTR